MKSAVIIFSLVLELLMMKKLV